MERRNIISCSYCNTDYNNLDLRLQTTDRCSLHSTDIMTGESVRLFINLFSTISIALQAPEASLIYDKISAVLSICKRMSTVVEIRPKTVLSRLERRRVCSLINRRTELNLFQNNKTQHFLIYFMEVGKLSLITKIAKIYLKAFQFERKNKL